MSVWLIEVYSAKACQSIADVLAKHHAISFNVILEPRFDGRCSNGAGLHA
jgi:hypothetical protein